MEVILGGAVALSARDLYRFYHSDDEETFALRGVSLEVGEGEMVAVMGPSGSGKSTLLSCLAGLDDPDGGSVRVFGERLDRRPEAHRARVRAASIGILIQSGNLVEHLSVAQNIEAARSLAPRQRRDTRPVVEILRLVGLEHRAHARPSVLSGGEAARAGIAVALANAPKILLADEPTGEVDAVNEAALIDLLRANAAAGTAIVVATHSARVAAAADRSVRMRDGAVVDD